MGILQSVRSRPALPPSVHRVTKEGLPTAAQAEYDAQVHEYFNRTSVLLQQSGGISATALGLIPDGTEYGQTDFDEIIGEAIAAGVRSIYVPPGDYNLGEDIEIPDGFAFRGENKSFSAFVMRHTGTGFIFTGREGNGGGLFNLSVVNGSNAPCVAYVQGIASVDGSSPDFLAIEGCNFTTLNGATTSQYGIIFDGNARTGVAPGNTLVGIRNTRIINCDIFLCTVQNISLRQARACYVSGVSHFAGDPMLGGVTKIEVTGASGFQSDGVFISTSTLGDLSTDWATKVIATGCSFTDVTMTANTLSSRVGYAYGAISNSSASSYVEQPDGTIV